MLRTVYLPNEKVDSLLLTIESLRSQLSAQERLGRERVAALLEDRRLRISEEHARRAAEAERLQRAEAELARTQEMLSKYTKDFLHIKHASLQAHRADVERVEQLRLEADASKEELEALHAETSAEVSATKIAAKQSSEQYVALFRRQVSDTERTMGVLKDQHNGLQQALAMRVKELDGDRGPPEEAAYGQARAPPLAGGRGLLAGSPSSTSRCSASSSSATGAGCRSPSASRICRPVSATRVSLRRWRRRRESCGR